nr:hypothetical protein [Tanacetum cinerariifolium]
LLINDSILSHESFDSNFEDNPLNLRPPPEPPDDNFDLEPEVISAVMEDIDEPDEHFNPGGEIFVSTNIKDVDYFPFMFVIRIFLPYLILPEISPLFLSAESEDTIFDPAQSRFSFPFALPKDEWIHGSSRAHDSVKWIENGAKASIYGFVAIKSAQCSKSRQSREKSPSMPWKRAQENESNVQKYCIKEPAEVEEVLEVVTAAKLMTKVVTTAQPTTTTIGAQVPKPSAPKRRRGVVIQDPEETATSVIAHTENDVIEQVKKSERQNYEMMRYQALKRKPLTEAQERKNMMIYLKNMAGFKMNFFKGMTYSEIRPLFEKHYNLIQAFLEKEEEELTVQYKEIEEEEITFDTLHSGANVNNVRLKVEEESKISLDLLSDGDNLKLKKLDLIMDDIKFKRGVLGLMDFN